MRHIDLKNKKILVTGAAGFIGSFLIQKLLETISSVIIQKAPIPLCILCYTRHSSSMATGYDDDKFLFDSALSYRSAPSLPMNSSIVAEVSELISSCLMNDFITVSMMIFISPRKVM